MNIDASGADIGQPLLFRTASATVGNSTLSSGSLWLRSDQYYRDLEDAARNDELEGINCGSARVPIRVNVRGVRINVCGDGEIGQALPPHYLVCLHGTSISESQRKEFGGFTFGVRNLARLSVEILFQVSQQITCTGYRYGQVFYQHSALAVSPFGSGAPIHLGGNPPLSLGPANQDVLRKRPIHPFIEQDEWRIAIFTDGYLRNDATEPVKINVAPSHFYACELNAQQHAQHRPPKR